MSSLLTTLANSTQPESCKESEKGRKWSRISGLKVEGNTAKVYVHVSAILSNRSES